MVLKAFLFLQADVSEMLLVPAWLRHNALEECVEGMLRRRGNVQLTGCFCNDTNQGQACTEAENRVLEGGVVSYPFLFD